MCPAWCISHEVSLSSDWLALLSLLQLFFCQVKSLQTFFLLRIQCISKWACILLHLHAHSFILSIRFSNLQIGWGSQKIRKKQRIYVVVYRVLFFLISTSVFLFCFFFLHVTILFASEIYSYYKSHIFPHTFFFGSFGAIFIKHFHVQSYSHWR